MKNNILQLSCSNFLVWQLTDQLCGIELWTIFSISTINFQSSRRDPHCLLHKIIDLMCHSWRKIILSTDGMRKVSFLFNAHQCFYRKGNDCCLPLFFIWHQPCIVNDWWNLLVFYRQSALYVSLDLHQTTVSASSPCLMQTGDSSLSITSIQSSRVHDCFSLTLISSV